MLNFARLFKAIGYSFSGLRDALRDEPAFRQETALALILIPLAVWLGDSNIERALMIGALLIVLIVELLNSAIEATVDRIGAEYSDLARKAKDLGSAAVFLALALAVAIWGLMLLE